MTIEQEIIKFYKNNYSKKEISSIFNISIFKLNKLLLKENIFQRKYTTTNKTRKNNIDLNCFKNIDNQNKAYLLGLLISDGNIGKLGYNFSLTSKDIEILEYAKTILKSSHKICTINSIDKRTNKPYTMYNINFCSKEMVKDLNKLGLYDNKSLNVKIPDIDKKYYWHLIRGLFDGDGSISTNITKKEGQLTFSLIGSLDTILFLKNIFLENNLKNNKIIQIKTTIKDKFIYKIHMGSYNDLLFIKENMYKNANYYLIRKYNKFNTLKKHIRIPIYKNNKKIMCSNIDTNEHIIFNNIRECLQHFNITRSDIITRVINGKRNHYKKYNFKYLN